MLVCLVTLLGAFCAFGADQIGECLSTGTEVICYEKVENISLWASTYSPAEGGINCDLDCRNKASGPVREEDYGHTAACAHDWIFATVETPFGSFLCDDRGGAIHLTWRDVFVPGVGIEKHWVWVTDFMFHSDELPYWAYTMIDDWSLSWD